MHWTIYGLRFGLDFRLKWRVVMTNSKLSVCSMQIMTLRLLLATSLSKDVFFVKILPNVHHELNSKKDRNGSKKQEIV